MVAADIETIYTEFNNALRGFVLKRVSDADAADDILQEVYLRIHTRIHTLRDESKLQSWIYQITRNAIVDYYRGQKSTVELTEAILAHEEEEAEAASELASSVGSFLGCLPEKYQQALVMTEYQGLTQQEMAKKLGISLSGAKSRVQRARRKLNEALLDCCHFELDRRGGIISYHPKCAACA